MTRVPTKKISRHRSLLAALGLLLGLAQAPAQAQVMCLWDPLGAQGDYSNMIKDYQLAAKRWNVSLDLKLYTDEAKAAEDFRNGLCDMTNMLGVRARPLNGFTSTIEAPGAITNYAQMREVLQLINSPGMEELMTNGDYEVVGVLPIGAGYPVVNDRAIDTLDAVTGKKMAVMAWDPLQAVLVQQVGIVPVPMSLSEVGPAFNSGKVDLVVEPMVMFKPLELAKGIGSKGGIVHRPALQFTLQLISRKKKFPSGFGHSSRGYMLSQMDFALGVIRNVEAAVDRNLWIYANKAEMDDYDRVMRNARTHLKIEGMYDRRMLSLLKRVRCHSGDAEAADCNSSAD